MANPPAATSTNPYDALITTCANSPARITQAYAAHRTRRAADQHTLLTAPTSPGLRADATLAALLAHPPTPDPRHNLVFWARPPARVRALVAAVQARLASAGIPGLFLPGAGALHMTVLEITHSRDAAAIAPLVDALGGEALRAAVDLPAALARGGRRARLARPCVVYDANAVALSYLPVAAAGEEKAGPVDAAEEESDIEDAPAQRFTYHHLRRAVYALVSSRLEVGSRYVLPSAHITLARFTQEGEGDAAAALVDAAEDANAWLAEEGLADGDGGAWDVGEEGGLELRAGSCWYGDGGWCVARGKGIGET